MNVGELETEKFYIVNDLKFSDREHAIKNNNDDKANNCKISRAKRELGYMGLMCPNCYNYKVIQYQYSTSIIVCND